MSEPNNPWVHSDAQESLSQDDLGGGYPSQRRSGPAGRDSRVGNDVNASGAHLKRGSIIGGDNISHRKTQISTGGIFVAIVAVVALLVVAVIVTKKVVEPSNGDDNNGGSANSTSTNEAAPNPQPAAATPDGQTCPGPITSSRVPPTNNNTVDLIGDACGFRDYPRADLEAVSYTSNSSSVSFAVAFTGSVTGKEMAQINLATDAQLVDDKCARTDISLQFYPEGKVVIYSGCDATGEVQTTGTASFTRSGGQLKTTIRKSLLPASSGDLFMRVSANTGMEISANQITTTTLSDYVPDLNLPPAKVTV